MSYQIQICCEPPYFLPFFIIRLYFTSTYGHIFILPNMALILKKLSFLHKLNKLFSTNTSIIWYFIFKLIWCFYTFLHLQSSKKINYDPCPHWKWKNYSFFIHAADFSVILKLAFLSSDFSTHLYPEANHLFKHIFMQCKVVFVYQDANQFLPRDLLYKFTPPHQLISEFTQICVYSHRFAAIPLFYIFVFLPMNKCLKYHYFITDFNTW